MRYVGLVFLGMVLWAGQASAAKVDAEFALEIISQGKTIGEFYEENVDGAYRYSRVVHNGKLYICSDGLTGGPHLDKYYVAYSCYDDISPR